MQGLQGLVAQCARASSREEAENNMAPLLCALRSREDLKRSFCHHGSHWVRFSELHANYFSYLKLFSK
eukprot:3965447-Amphidinium_carterae.1